jgi:hypothetical protein
MISNRSIPRATVIPVLAYPDVNQAAAWLCDAFGFSVRLRIGDHRVQLNVGDGAVIVREIRPNEVNAALGMGHSLHSCRGRRCPLQPGKGSRGEDHTRAGDSPVWGAAVQRG